MGGKASLTCRHTGWRNRFEGSLVLRLRWFFPAVLMTVLSVALPRPAMAVCLGSEYPLVEELMKDAGRHPVAALPRIDREIGRTPAAQQRKLAWLHAAKAAALGMAVQPNPDIAFIAQRAETTLDAGDPLLALLRMFAIEAAAPDAQKLRRQVNALVPGIEAAPASIPGSVCARTLAAYLLLKANHPEEAFGLAARAYQLADESRKPRQHAEAASILAQVVRWQNDFDYAIDLNSEALSFYEAAGLDDLTANDLHVRGWSYLRSGRPGDALRDFERSGEIARRTDNEAAIGYALAGQCEALMSAGQLAEGGPICEQAYLAAKGLGGPSEARMASMQAALMLNDGHPRRAVAVLDPLLSGKEGEQAPDYLASAYENRARALMALGRHREAARDMARAVELVRQRETAAASKSLAVTRARFQGQQLRNALRLQEEQQRQTRRLIWISAVSGALILILLAGLAVLLGRQRRMYRNQAITDALTGLPNRRHTEQRAKDIIRHAVARGQPAVIVLIDLDHFKSCNDRFGHDAGDIALRNFASTVRAALRPADVFGRWGGEEFLLAIPGADIDKARSLMDRLAQRAQEAKVDDAPDYVLRFSAGAVQVPGAADTLESALKCTDALLYEAKAAGRDRVHYAPRPAADRQTDGRSEPLAHADLARET